MRHCLFVSLTIAVTILGIESTLISPYLNRARADNDQAAVTIPDSLKVPSKHSLLFKAAAKGVQVYICTPKAKSKTDFEWTLKEPIADLFADSGVLLGKHYAGPAWELKSDGSKVVGVVINKINAPQKDAIPLLLLKAKSHQGNGIMSSVKWIQRLDTVGGKAPATGCDLTHPRAEARVFYTANYYFYATSPIK
jgi:hypothetical protein